MTPNLNASPLAALIANTTKTPNGTNSPLDTANLDPHTGLEPEAESLGFSDILQTLKIVSSESEATLPSVGQEATLPPGVVPQMPPEVTPVALPVSAPVVSQKAIDTVTGISPPPGGTPLPPPLREGLPQFEVRPTGSATAPVTVQPGPTPLVTTGATYQGPVTGLAAPIPTEPVPVANVISNFVKMQTFKVAQMGSGAVPGPAQLIGESAATITEQDGSLAELLRPTASAPDKPNPIQTASAALPLSRPAGTPGWDQSLGQRILWMVDNGLGQAELRLDPPHLGNVNVRISMRDDQAQVVFQAMHPAARDALESALPRLREMFADQGLQLGSADVGGQDSQSADDSGRGSAENGGESANAAFDPKFQSADVETVTGGETQTPQLVGPTGHLLVDEFV